MKEDSVGGHNTSFILLKPSFTHTMKGNSTVLTPGNRTDSKQKDLEPQKTAVDKFCAYLFETYYCECMPKTAHCDLSYILSG